MIVIRFYLTHFWPIFSIYIPWEHRKTKVFLVFSGGINGNVGQEWFNTLELANAQIKSQFSSQASVPDVQSLYFY